MILVLMMGLCFLVGCSQINEFVEEHLDSLLSSDKTIDSIDGKIYSVGDTLEANGLKLRFKEYEEWQQENSFIGSIEGKKIVRAYFVIENTSGSEKSVGSWDFSCFSDDFTANEYIYADDILKQTTLAVGDKVEGYVYFEVPSNAKDMIVEYSSNYWVGERAVFKMVLEK